MMQTLLRWLATIFGDVIVKLVRDWREDAGRRTAKATEDMIKEKALEQVQNDAVHRGGASDVLARLRKRQSDGSSKQHGAR